MPAHLPHHDHANYANGRYYHYDGMAANEGTDLRLRFGSSFD